MDRVTYLINASVADAQQFLEGRLNKEPQTVKELAQKALETWPLRCESGNFTRIAMLRTIIKRADKLLVVKSK